MTLRLRDEDRRAVDLLLDRAASGSGVNPSHAGNGNGNRNGHGHSHGHGFAQVSADVQARLAGAQKVLQMLDMMPAEEPPQDLLSRTLRRVDTELANHPSVLRAPQPQPLTGLSMHQPHA